MLYKELLKNMTDCPFCDRQPQVMENEYAYLTYAIAPYHKHHMLVIPKKHVESILDITDEEMESVEKLQRQALNILYELGYDSASFLVREGNSKTRTVGHIHFHVIPQINLGDLDHYGNERRVLTGEEIDSVMKDFTGALDKVRKS